MFRVVSAKPSLAIRPQKRFERQVTTSDAKLANAMDPPSSIDSLPIGWVVSELSTTPASSTLAFSRPDAGPPVITNDRQAEYFLAACRAAAAKYLAILRESRSIVRSFLGAENPQRRYSPHVQTAIDENLEKLRLIATQVGVDDRSGIAIPIPSRPFDGSLSFQHTGITTRAVRDCQIIRADFDLGDCRPIEVRVDRPAQTAQIVLPCHVISNPLTSAIRLELKGEFGTEQFDFKAGTLMTQLAATLNLFSDVTGVAAVMENFPSGAIDSRDVVEEAQPKLKLQSVGKGSNAFIDVDIRLTNEEGCLAATTYANRAQGSDIQASVAGVPANSRGNTLQPPSASLDLYLELDQVDAGDNFHFSVTGGGVLLKTSRLNARLGIDCLLPSRFGGPSGRLYEIGSGQSHCLISNADRTLQILEEASARVTRLYDALLACENQLGEPPLTEGSSAVKGKSVCAPPPQRSRRSSSHSQPIMVGARESLIRFDTSDLDALL